MAMTTSSSMSVKPRERGGGENSGERTRLAARCRRPIPPKRDVLHRAKSEHNWSADGLRPQQPRKHKGAWHDPDASPTLPAAARRDVARSGARTVPRPQQPGKHKAAWYDPDGSPTLPAAARRDVARSETADDPHPQQPGKHKGAWHDPDGSPTLPAAARRDVARSGAADDPHPQQPGTITAAVDRTRICNRTCCEPGRFALRNIRAARRCSRSRQFIAPWIRAPGTPCPVMFMSAGTRFDPLQMILPFGRVFINHMFKDAPRL